MAMSIPKWALPAGLAAAVVAGLAFLRKPSPQGGDIVAVSAGRLLQNGQQVPPPVTIPQGYAVAVQLDAAQALPGDWSGQIIGWVDPATKEVVRPTVAIAGPPITVPKSSVLGLYRGMPLKKVA